MLPAVFDARRVGSLRYGYSLAYRGQLLANTRHPHHAANLPIQGEFYGS